MSFKRGLTHTIGLCSLVGLIGCGSLKLDTSRHYDEENRLFKYRDGFDNSAFYYQIAPIIRFTFDGKDDKKDY